MRSAIHHAARPRPAWRAVRRLPALVGIALLAAGCSAVGDPGWSMGTSSGCRQIYGNRGSTSATRPDVVFLCAQSP
jgi:hypothetical protein